MKSDRPDLIQLEQDIYSALEKVDTPEFLKILDELAGESAAYLKAHLDMEHSFPSPSGVMKCRLQQWFKGKGVEGGDKIPAYWTVRMASGILSEPFWQAVLRMCPSMEKFPIARPMASVTCGDYMRGKGDFLIGDMGLGESKEKNGWIYKRLLEGQGVAFELPGEYMQMQQYLAGYNRDWCLYMVTPDSPGMLQGMMRNYKRYKDIPNWELPICYLEIVERRELDVLAGLSRAKMIFLDQLSDEHPPREYDGQIRKGMHPCNICPVRRQCNELYNETYISGESSD